MKETHTIGKDARSGYEALPLLYDETPLRGEAAPIRVE